MHICVCIFGMMAYFSVPLEAKDLPALCCKKDFFLLGLPHDCYSNAHPIDWVSYTGTVQYIFNVSSVRLIRRNLLENVKYVNDEA